MGELKIEAVNGTMDEADYTVSAEFKGVDCDYAEWKDAPVKLYPRMDGFMTVNLPDFSSVIVHDPKTSEAVLLYGAPMKNPTIQSKCMQASTSYHPPSPVGMIVGFIVISTSLLVIVGTLVYLRRRFQYTPVSH